MLWSRNINAYRLSENALTAENIAAALAAKPFTAPPFDELGGEVKP